MAVEFPKGHPGWDQVPMPGSSDDLEYIALFFAADEQKGLLQASGCGVVTSAFVDKVSNQLCMVIATVGHVIIDIANHLYGERRAQGPFAPDDQQLVQRSITDSKARVSIVHGGQVFVGRVYQVYWSPEVDIALAMVLFPDMPTDIKMLPQNQINSDPPVPGQVIAMIGLAGTPEIVKPVGNFAAAAFHPKWQTLVGEITAILNRGALSACPMIQTTIPAPSGMSGGPVYLVGLVNGQAQISNICGLLSSSVIVEDTSGDAQKARGHSLVLPAQEFYLTHIDPGAVRDTMLDISAIGYGYVVDVGTRRLEIQRYYKDGKYWITRVPSKSSILLPPRR